MPVAVVIDYIFQHRDRVVEGKKLGVETPDPKWWSSQAAAAVVVGVAGCVPNAVISS